MHGGVVELGLRFTPGARENLGSNPSDPTTPNYDLFSIIFTRALTVEFNDGRDGVYEQHYRQDDIANLTKPKADC